MEKVLEIRVGMIVEQVLANKASRKIKKVITKKIIIPIILSCMPFLLISCTAVVLISSVTVNFFGSKTIDENITEDENEKMFDEIKNKTEWINNYSTFDERGTRLNKLSDYYGTDIRFKLGWEYTLAYLKYQQYSSENSSANTVDDVKNNIDRAVKALAPKFTYKSDKITTVREYKDIDYLFDVKSGLDVPNTIKVFNEKPSDFTAKNYSVGTSIYINSENKTYKVKNGVANKFKTKYGLPTYANSIIVYSTKPDEFYASDYSESQKIYIYDEDTTYEVVRIHERGYIGLYFEKHSGKPQELNSTIIYDKAKKLKDANEYRLSDIIYVIDENKTYSLETTVENSFNIFYGKPDELLNIITLSDKPANFDRKSYKTGDIVYLINENKTYKAIEKEVTRTEKKEENKYFITEARNIQGTFNIKYRTESQVTVQNDKEKITVTKPVLDGINQADTSFTNLRAIISNNYVNEDVDKAADAIISAAYNYLDKDITDIDTFFTGSGNFTGSGEAFSGGEKEFVDKVSAGAIKSWEKYHVLPSITIAQAILESGWGKSGLAKNGNNLFGIKAFSSWTGPYVEMATKEYDSSGAAYFIIAKFRAYNCWDDSVEDHSKILLQSNFAGVIAANDYKEAAQALSRGGYATDPNYPELITSIIEQYNLNQYDNH